MSLASRQVHWRMTFQTCDRTNLPEEESNEPVCSRVGANFHRVVGSFPRGDEVFEPGKWAM